MNVFSNIPGLSIAPQRCTVATFCLLGACAILCVGGRLFDGTLCRGFTTCISVWVAEIELFTVNILPTLWQVFHDLLIYYSHCR